MANLDEKVIIDENPTLKFKVQYQTICRQCSFFLFAMWSVNILHFAVKVYAIWHSEDQKVAIESMLNIFDDIERLTFLFGLYAIFRAMNAV
jgi:hypothetical protein